MSSVTWRYLSGDTADFAIELTLIQDDLDDWMVAEDERASWGSFSLWLGGINACEHAVQGEYLRAAHWYLLPIAEWFIDNWDPLFHEERSVFPQAGVTAASMAKYGAMQTELSLIRGDDSLSDQVDTHFEWEERHSLRASAPGALLPDLYIRRYGDFVEFSSGDQPVAGEGPSMAFSSVGRVLVRVEKVASALLDAVGSLVARLRDGESLQGRLDRLSTDLGSIHSAARESGRFAWLSGVGGNAGEFQELWREFHSSLPRALELRADQIGQSRSAAGNSVLLASPATLLFGCLSPDIAPEDVHALYIQLLRLPQRNTRTSLLKYANELRSTSRPVDLSPGEEGSFLGEQAWYLLVEHSASIVESRVDVEGVLEDLGVQVNSVELKDPEIRAVSVLSRDGASGIVINSSYRLGVRPPIRRFTLAHELGHLLLDWDRAADMVVATGPWAPREIEQRANAFAAAFLMPAKLIDNFYTGPHVGFTNAFTDLAGALDVSMSALVNRLQNLGRISAAAAEQVRTGLDH